MIYTNDYESPLGNILLAGDNQGLTGLWFTEGVHGAWTEKRCPSM